MKSTFTDDIYNRFIKGCKTHKLIRSGDLVLAAVSGGPDSTALLDLLKRWHNDGEFFTLFAAHYNHHLRPEAVSEQQHVEDFCRNLQVECHVGEGSVAMAAKQQRRSEHDIGREMRYEFLVRTAQLRGKRHVAGDPTKYEKLGLRRRSSAVDSMLKPYTNQTVNRRGLTAGSGFSKRNSSYIPIVATGHHFDDQVETVLMRLFAGSGIDGLAGIRRILLWGDPPQARIIRPLLDFRREELEAYCKARSLSFVVDPSNKDTQYPRNRLRQEIIPLLVNFFGESSLQGITRSAELIDLAGEVISVIAVKAFEDAVLVKRECDVALDYHRFNSYLSMIRYSCIKECVNYILKTLSFVKYERYTVADQHILNHRNGIIELSNGVSICVHRGRIWIFREPSSFSLKCFRPADIVEIPDWGRLTTEIRPVESCKIPPPRGELYIDPNKLSEDTLTIEPAQPGARFIPLGMTGRRMVSDFLNEEGIPPHRRQYPVIRSKGRIAVIPPLRIAEPFKLTPDTRIVIVFRWEDF